MAFPSLPTCDPPWPSAVIIAAGQIYDVFSATTRMIKSGNYNTHCVSSHKNILYNQVQPLIESVSSQEPGLERWISDVCSIMLNLHDELEQISQSELKPGPAASFTPYELVQTGRQRQPSKKISCEALDDINNEELRMVVQEAMSAKLDTGIAYLTGHLHRNRLRQAVHDVDQVGATLRQQATTKKPRGRHHKLIKWGIVIHGIINGYLRKIVGLRVNFSNTAPTVANMFIDTIIKHGVPSQNRTLTQCDLEIEGMIKYGVYDDVKHKFVYGDECEGMDEEAIDQYYRYPKEGAGSGDEGESDEEGDTEHNPVPEHDSKHDLGHVDDLMDNENPDSLIDDLNNSLDGYAVTDGIRREDKGREDEEAGGHNVNVNKDVDPNIDHEPVDVPTGDCPFTADELATFQECINHTQERRYLPDGYGVRPDEWEDNIYPDSEGLAIRQASELKQFIYHPTSGIHKLFYGARHSYQISSTPMGDCKEKHKARSPACPTLSHGERNSSIEEIPPLSTQITKKQRCALNVSSSSNAPQASSSSSQSTLPAFKIVNPITNDNTSAATTNSCTPNNTPGFQFKNFLVPSRRSSATTSSKLVSSSASSRSLGPSKYLVNMVMVLLYGVVEIPDKELAPGKSNYAINLVKSQCTFVGQLGKLISEGWAICPRVKSDSYIFNEDWTEDEVWDKVSSLLSEACQTLLQWYNPDHHVNLWLPCQKQAFTGRFKIYPIKGKVTGARVKEIGGDVGKKQHGKGVECFCTVSTTHLPDIPGGTTFSDWGAKSATKSQPSVTASSSKPLRKSGRSCQSPESNYKEFKPSTSRPISRASCRTPSSSRPRKDCIDDYDFLMGSDSGSDVAFTTGGTEYAPSHEGSPLGVLNESFSEFNLDTLEDDDHISCIPELPAEAVYCPGPLY
ncbi:hypothetical protein BJ165DRAFT_1401354 [Panaeolus papilionaceus]|nr:hypothetical protein BJ165DRAFT_1401354 [Panaeolus papilionaceus]